MVGFEKEGCGCSSIFVVMMLSDIGTGEVAAVGGGEAAEKVNVAEEEGGNKEEEGFVTGGTETDVAEDIISSEEHSFKDAGGGGSWTGESDGDVGADGGGESMSMALGTERTFTRKWVGDVWKAKTTPLSSNEDKDEVEDDNETADDSMAFIEGGDFLGVGFLRGFLTRVDGWVILIGAEREFDFLTTARRPPLRLAIIIYFK